jgi:hypothetical protein
MRLTFFNNLKHSLLSAGSIPFIYLLKFPTLAKFCHAQVQWLFSIYTEHLWNMASITAQNAASLVFDCALRHTGKFCVVTAPQWLDSWFYHHSTTHVCIWQIKPQSGNYNLQNAVRACSNAVALARGSMVTHTRHFGTLNTERQVMLPIWEAPDYISSRALRGFPQSMQAKSSTRKLICICESSSSHGGEY